MGCYDCVCEKRNWKDSGDDFCQLSTCNTFNNYEEVGLQLRLYDVIDEIVITKADNDKFELLDMLDFRNDKMKLKDILLYME